MRGEHSYREAPHVFDYLDARAYVRDCIAYLKLTKQGFSFRRFTKEIGMASPGHIHLMLSGKQSLTEVAAEKLARGFELNKAETKRLIELVMVERVSEESAKENLKQKIVNDQMRKRKAKLAEHQFAYCTNWYYPVIREMVGLSDFRLDLAWIADRLSGKVSTSEVSKAIKTLLALGMIRTEGSALVQSESMVSTDDVTPRSDLLSQFHKAMMQKAQEAQDAVVDSMREISGMTLTIDAAEFEKLKCELVEFRNQVFQKYGLVKPTHDRVCQVNIQFFPLTK